MVTLPQWYSCYRLHQRVHACACRDREEAKQRRKDKEVLKKMKKVGLPQAVANAAKVRQPNIALGALRWLISVVCCGLF